MPNDNPIPFVVIAQCPQYGTLTWGPFATRAHAAKFVHGGGLQYHIVATYEETPAGFVVWEQPLYEPYPEGGE